MNFEKVYGEQKSAVFSYLHYMTKDYAIAEDLCQEAFLKIYRSCKAFKGDCSEKTWCLQIARNTFLDWVRKKQPVLLKEEEYISLTDTEEKQPEKLAIKEENINLIRRILLALPEEARTIILLRDYEGLSYQEIGEIIEVSTTVVKGRLFRARERYRKLYQQLGGE